MAQTDSVLLIDAGEVDALLRGCLYSPEEVDGLAEGETPAGCVIVEGIAGQICLHPDRLESVREKVTEWLRALPHTFRKNVGGGWSFLRGCLQENGIQWGEQRSVDQLFCLGQGLGLVSCQLPRELWSALPGGMPYYVINIE